LDRTSAVLEVISVISKGGGSGGRESKSLPLHYEIIFHKFYYYIKYANFKHRAVHRGHRLSSLCGVKLFSL
jgi:hypothetical protein